MFFILFTFLSRMKHEHRVLSYTVMSGGDLFNKTSILCGYDLRNVTKKEPSIERLNNLNYKKRIYDLLNNPSLHDVNKMAIIKNVSHDSGLLDELINPQYGISLLAGGLLDDFNDTF